MTNFGLVSKVPWYQETGYSGIQTVIIMFVKKSFSLGAVWLQAALF